MDRDPAYPSPADHLHMICFGVEVKNPCCDQDKETSKTTKGPERSKLTDHELYNKPPTRGEQQSWRRLDVNVDDGDGSLWDATAPTLNMSTMDGCGSLRVPKK
ncbi:hypothetical protein ASPCADRAFT_5406 [Aspergillus carbonarius ITEM 5010]|uniref:Uncharacterized protein n=1 Tax=Aspergillus carbonarius (strain ITEM 5010) TaxID=602072 RepID=A0A1R3RNM0_ASPC5|nr:hypothetical protein ASPCADRAFT_5406 [Aspergillus carbonarius ITEM 5010]